MLEKHLRYSRDLGKESLEVVLGALNEAAPFDANLLSYESPRHVLSQCAEALYQKPPFCAVAVTGTNGKTSVTHFIHQFLNGLELKNVSFGTLGLVSNIDVSLPFTLPSLNTLPPLLFHRALACVTEQSASHVVFEASSHGIDQCRLHHIDLDVAVFTNLSQDHLDYHENMENYYLSKKKLFSEILSSSSRKKGAVLHVNNAYGLRLFNELSDEFPDLPIFACGMEPLLCPQLKPPSRSRSEVKRSSKKKIDKYPQTLFLKALSKRICEMTYNGVSYIVPMREWPSFQLENILCALAALIMLDVPFHELILLLPSLTAPRGRFEQINTLAEADVRGSVFVDYAHTPEALERALKTARALMGSRNHQDPHLKGRLVVVFGCGGDRDKGKRPDMGRIASLFSDVAIVTDDNPRFEDPSHIRESIISGIPKDAKTEVLHIADRKEAIHAALALLTEDDVLLIAGKGHEVGQIVKGEVLYFDDACVVLEWRRGIE